MDLVSHHHNTENSVFGTTTNMTSFDGKSDESASTSNGSFSIMSTVDVICQT